MGDLFAALDDVLEDTSTDNVSEGGLCAFHEGLADIGDAKGGFVGGGDVIVDYGGELKIDVIFGHADLFGDLDNLNLDVHLDDLFGQRVDLNETRVDGAVEATEFGDETDVSLTDGFVWVGANDTAWDGTAEADARAEGIDLMVVRM